MASHHLPDTPGPDLALGVQMWRFQHAFRAVHESALADVQISAAEYGALSSIRDNPGGTGAELARSLLITRQAAGRTLTRLTQAGLVQLEEARSGPSLPASLTAQGRSTLSHADKEVAQAQARLLSTLVAAERKTLIQLLQRCADNYAATSGARMPPVEKETEPVSPFRE